MGWPDVRSWFKSGSWIDKNVVTNPKVYDWLQKAYDWGEVKFTDVSKAMGGAAGGVLGSKAGPKGAVVGVKIGTEFGDYAGKSGVKAINQGTKSLADLVAEPRAKFSEATSASSRLDHAKFVNHSKATITDAKAHDISHHVTIDHGHSDHVPISAHASALDHGTHAHETGREHPKPFGDVASGLAPEHASGHGRASTQKASDHVSIGNWGASGNHAQATSVSHSKAFGGVAAGLTSSGENAAHSHRAGSTPSKAFGGVGSGLIDGHHGGHGPGATHAAASHAASSHGHH